MTNESNTKPFVKGFKYRIYPTEEQKVYLAKIFGSCRFVYNHFLAKASNEYKEYRENNNGKKPASINRTSLSAELTKLKVVSGYEWLTECPAHVLQYSVDNLANSYDRFFKRVSKYPSFKSKYKNNSAKFYCKQTCSLKEGKLFLAKCSEGFKVRWDKRILPSEFKFATVSKTSSDEYYVSFTCEFYPEKTNGQEITGIDVGLKDFAVLSTGEVIKNPRHYVKKQKRLRILQRRLSKKKKGSSNRNKARLKVAKLHAKIANVRMNFIHNLTTQVVKDSKVIAIETLSPKNMSKNHKLAKHILDASWGMFFQQLIYKAKHSQNCYVIMADRFFPSSNICSVCSTKRSTRLTLSERQWTCECCKTKHDRDLNAAINLKLMAQKFYEETLISGTKLTNPTLTHNFMKEAYNLGVGNPS